MKYRQCHLQNANRELTSWIPHKLAVLGSTLKLKEDGTWEDGWRIVRVGSEAVEEERIHDAHEYRVAIKSRRKFIK